MRRSKEPSLLKRSVAVVIGGAAGALAMEVFQSLVSRISSKAEHWRLAESDPTHHPQTEDRVEEERTMRDKHSPTAKAADSLAEHLTGRPLPGWLSPIAAEAFHYATGIVPGAIYASAMAAPKQKAKLLAGGAFGFLVWVLLNQILIPKLGLTKRASSCPASTRLYGLAAHLIYGTTTELISRAILRPIA